MNHNGIEAMINNFLRHTLALTFLAFAVPVAATEWQTTTDVVPGGRHYREINGLATGFSENDGPLRWDFDAATMVVFVVHLPSRAGGKAGDKNRRLAAQTLWAAVDSVNAHAAAHAPHPVASHAPHIIVMGDFNAARRDRIFKRAPLLLTDDTHAPGTYCYRGYWQWIDHILVSPSVQTAGPARPVTLPWLLEENHTYGGVMPRRTYRGPTYHGGVSDHLPVLLELQF